MTTASCNSCHKEFADFGELAIHILSSPKSTHKQGRRWAAKYQHRYLLRKQEFNNRQPLTEEQKESKKDNRLILSGDMEYVNTICPKCKQKRRPLLPVEYTKSPTAWNIDGKLAKLCISCGGET